MYDQRGVILQLKTQTQRSSSAHAGAAGAVAHLLFIQAMGELIVRQKQVPQVPPLPTKKKEALPLALQLRELLRQSSRMGEDTHRRVQLSPAYSTLEKPSAYLVVSSPGPRPLKGTHTASCCKIITLPQPQFLHKAFLILRPSGLGS